MQQYHVFALPLPADAVVGLLLGGAQRFGGIQLWWRGIVEPAHLVMEGGEHAPLHQLAKHSNRDVRLVEQFVARQGYAPLALGRLFIGTDIGHAQEGVQQGQLLLCPLHAVHGQLQSPGLPPSGGKGNMHLGLGFIGSSGFHASRQGCIIHLAYRREIIIGHPPPQLQLPVGHHRCIIEHHVDGFHLERGSDVVDRRNQPYTYLASTKWYKHTLALTYTLLHGVGNRIGEQLV